MTRGDEALYDDLYDIGKAVNPMLVEGQLIGIIRD